MGGHYTFIYTLSSTTFKVDSLFSVWAKRSSTLLP